MTAASTRPSIILHIGQHKTGSKALQSFLAHNRGPLLDERILYPGDDFPRPAIRAYAISHHHLFALLRREALEVCAGKTVANQFWRRVGTHCQGFNSARAVFESVEATRVKTGAAQVILSAEDCFDMQTAHDVEFSLALVDAGARRLAELAAEMSSDVRLVVYLRRQDHLLAAHYVQYIKGSSVHDVEFTQFARAFAPRLDSLPILERWAAAFGPECICVRPYERAALPAGIVPDFFEQVLHLEVPDTCSLPSLDVESVNRTLGRDFVEYIRILNRRAARGESIFDREAVLEAALWAGPDAGGPAGIAAWLAPADLRSLLAAHTEGNSVIAHKFLGRDDGRLFAEPPPAYDPGWRPYPGLTPEAATAISLAIHETIQARSLSGEQQAT